MKSVSHDEQRLGGRVCGVVVNAISWEGALSTVVGLARAKTSASVAFCNVHVVTTAEENALLREALAKADLCLPDGYPVAWFMRKLGYENQPKISGPDFTLQICRRAAEASISIYLYGSTQETLTKFADSLRNSVPELVIAGMLSPPFRELSAAEDQEIVSDIQNSGAGIVLVGLGCPKQEIWMASHKGRVPAVMLGVGAAFDFHAGTLKRAPEWMQSLALEWLHRLWSEPNRLMARYLRTNSAFVLWVAKNWFRRAQLIRPVKSNRDSG